MKSIEKIIEVAEIIERFPEIRQVAVEHDKLVITLKTDDIDAPEVDSFQVKIYELIGEYPTPCDQEIADWYVYFKDI